MSVRTGERQESNLKYVQDAQKLCEYTLEICNNPNHFPEQTLANQIKYEALQILCNIRQNLSAYTYNKKDTKSLLNHQLAALGHIDALYALLELAYNNKTYQINANSMEHWTGLIVSLEDSIHKLGLVPIC